MADAARRPAGQDWPVVFRVVALAVVAWLAACAFLFVWPQEDEVSRADAVVVLSGGRKFRLEKGLELVRDGVSDTLVISDGRADDWPEANALCANGADGFRVLCFKPDPYSTQGEAQAVARLGRARGWRTVAVVTSTFHVYRARLLFERCFAGDVAAIGAEYKLRYLPLALFWETGKLAHALTVDRDC
jgi:uncharacterized SAM-binding protein YcdF (DUF218 family)